MFTVPNAQTNPNPAQFQGQPQNPPHLYSPAVAGQQPQEQVAQPQEPYSEVMVEMDFEGAKITFSCASVEEAQQKIMLLNRRPVDPANAPETMVPGAQAPAPTQTPAANQVPGPQTPQAPINPVPPAQPQMPTQLQIDELAQEVAESFCEKAATSAPGANRDAWVPAVMAWVQGQFNANPSMYVDIAKSTPGKVMGHSQAIVNLINPNASYLLTLAQ